jgi:uncharacterized protein YndB with AHSA1/START domain
MSDTATVQVYRIYIKATPEAVWAAITDPQWTARYGYQMPTEMELRLGGAVRALCNEGMRAQGAPEVGVDGEILELDPPRKLVQTWRLLMDPSTAAEGFTRVTYEIRENKDGGSVLTVSHDVSTAPGVGALVSGMYLGDGNAGGGWAWVLSDLKSLLETGSGLSG